MTRLGLKAKDMELYGMTAIYWLLFAMLWAAISIEVCIWLCPRIFRYMPQDDE